MGLRTSIIELCRWLKAQWVAEVPDDLAICEFECRKSECSFDGWANCVRRISQTPREIRVAENALNVEVAAFR